MSNFIIPQAISAARAVKILNVSNQSVVNARTNPYEGKSELQRKFEKDEAIGTSILGTPILSDLSLLGVTYTNNATGQEIEVKNDRFQGQGQQTGQTQKGGFYMNLETVIITVARSFNIIETVIQGRDNSVFEYIGANNHELSIQGVITGGNGIYPRDEVNRLKAWLDAPVAKPIRAWWLDNLGITDIVVSSYNIPQIVGGYSYQTFSISAKSFVATELRLS
jgi:hypothetical protein